MSFIYTRVKGGYMVGTGSTEHHNAVYNPGSMIGPITIPYQYKGKKIISISQYAFSYLPYITHVFIKADVEKLEQCSFLYCSNLMSINIPASCTTIESSAIGIGNYLNLNLISNVLDVYIEPNSKLSFLSYHSICCKQYVKIHYCGSHDVEAHNEAFVPNTEVYSPYNVSLGNIVSTNKEMNCNSPIEKERKCTQKVKHGNGMSLHFLTLFIILSLYYV